MTLIPISDVLDLTDSDCAQVLEGLNEFDNEGVLATSFTLGAKNNQNRVLALGDAEQEADLMSAANAAFEASKAYPLLYLPCKQLVQKLNSHIGKYFLGGIQAYLLDEGVRVHYVFRDIYIAIFGYQLPPEVVFSPVVEVDLPDVPYGMSEFVTTGPGVGTYTPGAPIDSAKYYAANLEMKNTGALPITATYDFTCVKWDDTTEIKQVVAVALPVGNVLGIGTLGVDYYKEVTLIAVTGGVATDQINVQSILERTPAL